MPFSLKAPTRSRTRWSLLRRKRGWIGIDVGAALTKMVQLECDGNGYRISARWCAPTVAGSSLIDAVHNAGDEADFSQQLQQARSVFRGRRAAAVLSASCTAHRCLDVPAGDAEELRRMVHEEVEADRTPGAAERCIGFWQTPNPVNSDASMVQLSILDMDREVSLRLAGNLLRAGFDCRILDGLPCALARAVQLSEPARAEQPTAIIDIGHSTAVLVVAVTGNPQFTRVLRGCGLNSFLSPIQQNLPLSASESWQLLKRIGVAPIDVDTRTEASAQVVHQLLSGPIAKLISETTRTVAYLHQSLPAIFPDKLIICGGGSFVPHLRARLASATGLEVAGWKIPATEPHLASEDDSLFAVAAAASALAGEA